MQFRLKLELKAEPFARYGDMPASIEMKSIVSITKFLLICKKFVESCYRLESPRGFEPLVTGVKVLPHHPTIVDFIEYINARKARIDISDISFCVRLCVRMKLWHTILSTY